jgi:hypothetical protein
VFGVFLEKPVENGAVALSSNSADDLQTANTLFYSSIICNTKTSQENTL